MRHLAFWFDFSSTYSYLAAMRVERLCHEHGVDLEWKPFLLGPIFQEQGLTTSPFNVNEAKGRHMWRDMERQCAKNGLALHRPTVFPRNSMLPARLACAHAKEPWIAEFVRGVFHANFAEDTEIAHPSVIGRILEKLGQPTAACLGRAGDAKTKAMLREQTARAQSLGIFGAPTFIVGDELFWGNDRLEDALSYAANVAT
jgi:2-hydroxychromene-2-carboxylate isomerase